MSDIRTPPSLKWLLDKRSRLLGEIERLQEEHASLRQNLADEIQEAERRVAELKQKQVVSPADKKLLKVRQSELASVDATLQLHHIQVDLSQIAPIRSQRAERLLAHGEITRFIYQHLASVYPNSVTTTELATLISTASGLDMDEPLFNYFRRRVKQRLKGLAYHGKISAVHSKITSFEGRWRLNSATQETDQIEAPQAGDSPASILATIETDHY